MLLSRLQGNLPRVELVVWMAISDCHRLESDVVNNEVDKHLHHHQRGPRLREHDYQTGRGSMYKSVYTTCEAWAPACVRPNLIKGVCDTCRACRAWGEPGHTVLPSTALPGNFNEDVECDLMFYKQEHNIFHITGRCIRYATGIEIPDKTMTTVLDAYRHCWM
eukprot:1197046-Pyramimonas_sp.AAC.1